MQLECVQSIEDMFMTLPLVSRILTTKPAWLSKCLLFALMAASKCWVVSEADTH
jgi:hypothetical protein